MRSRSILWLLACFYLTIFHIKAQSVGGTASGASTYCDTLNSGFASITGYVGNVVTWQESTDGGANWVDNNNTFTSQSYYHLKQSTCYRAIVQSGSFPPDTSTIVCITIYAYTAGGNIVGGGAFCVNSGSGMLNLVGQTGNVLNWQYSTNGGGSWTNVSNTGTSLSYSNITQNTIYEAVVQNSSYCLIDTSARASFTIDPISVSGILSYTGNDTVCYGTNSTAFGLSGNTGNVLNWIQSINSGASWASITNSTTTYTSSGLIQNTQFATIVKNGSCPSDTSNIAIIYVTPQNTVNAGFDTTITQGQSVTLNGSGIGGIYWTPTSSLSNSTILNPVATPITSTDYILTITDNYSCANSDTVSVTVTPLTFEGVISTVFSPNGDGVNDNWHIEKIHFYPNNEVIVYNIYGNEVFSKKGYTNDWQGTYNGAQLPDGTYFYVVKIDNISSVIKGSLDIIKGK